MTGKSPVQEMDSRIGRPTASVREPCPGEPKVVSTTDTVSNLRALGFPVEVIVWTRTVGSVRGDPPVSKLS